MRITARGWSRNAGDNVILDRELQDAKVGTVSPYYPPRDVLEMARKPNEVRLQIGPRHLTLGGKYVLSITLTDDDVARLFLACNPQFAALMEGIFAPPKSDAEAAE